MVLFALFYVEAYMTDCNYLEEYGLDMGSNGASFSIIERKTMTTSTNAITSPKGDWPCYEIYRCLQKSEVRELTDQYMVSILCAVGEYFEAQKEEATAAKTTNDIHPTFITALPTINDDLDQIQDWAKRSLFDRPVLWLKAIRNT